MVFNPFFLTADQLLMLGYAVTDLTNQFSVLDMAHRRSPRFHRGLFSGLFDQISQYPAIWSSQMVLNPFIWTADQLLMLGGVAIDLKNAVLYIQNRLQGLTEPSEADFRKNLNFRSFCCLRSTSIPSSVLLMDF